jgi:hypothetical protein
MGIEIKINIDFTARQKKIVRAAVVMGAVIGALGVGIAIAAPIDTTWISGGAQVSATSLKSDLDGLQTQITAGRFVVTIDGGQYSVGATAYCGSTAQTVGDMSGLGGPMGYAGAKQACQNKCSPAAHMCSAEELTRSAQLGIFPSTGWYASGVGHTSNTQTVTDCDGWTTSATYSGGVYQPQGDPGYEACSIANPVLCCD